MKREAIIESVRQARELIERAGDVLVDMDRVDSADHALATFLQIAGDSATWTPTQHARHAELSRATTPQKKLTASFRRQTLELSAALVEVRRP